MATSRDCIEAAELFTMMPVMLLARLVDALDYSDPQDEMRTYIELQKRLISEFKKRDNMDPDFADALHNVALECYTTDDYLQTQVDIPDLPFDMSVADHGTWLSAWVWVPNECIEAEKFNIQERRRDATEPNVP